MAAIRVAPLTPPDVSKRIEIVSDVQHQTVSVVVDGIDITYWCAAEPVVVTTARDALTRVTVTLTAPEVIYTIVP